MSNVTKTQVRLFTSHVSRLTFHVRLRRAWKSLTIASIILFLCIPQPSFEQDRSHLERGIQLFQNKDYETAKIFFTDKVKTNKQDDVAHYYLGRCYLSLKDHDKAIDHIKKAIQINPNVADYHFSLGQALGIKARKSNILKQASIARKLLKEFKQTVEIDSTHIGGHIGLANYYSHAPSIIGGDIHKAYSEAEILLKLDEAKGRLILISLYEKENKIDQAQQAYEQYEKSFVDTTADFQFYNQYGYFLLRHKNFDKATEIFKKQISIVPDKANPYDSLGDCYMEAGKFAEALAAYQKALDIDPNFKPTLKKIKKLKKQRENE